MFLVTLKNGKGFKINYKEFKCILNSIDQGGGFANVIDDEETVLFVNLKEIASITSPRHIL